MNVNLLQIKKKVKAHLLPAVESFTVSVLTYWQWQSVGPPFWFRLKSSITGWIGMKFGTDIYDCLGDDS